MNLLKIFTIVTLALFPFGELLRISLGNNIQLNAMDIGVGLIALTWIIETIRQKKLPKSRIIKPVSFFILVASLSLIANSKWLKLSELIPSSLYLVRWIAYVSVYFAVSSYKHNFKNTLKQGLIICGGVMLGAGYIQYFLFPSLKPIYYLGWDEHLYRMVSTFLDPNFAGTFFVLYALLLADQLLSLVHKNSSKKTIIISLLLCATLLAIFLTYSRGAILMLIIASTVYLCLIHKKKLVFGVFSIVLLAFLATLPFAHTENFNLLRTNSSFARVKSWSESWQIFQKNPILGVGFNTYRYAQLKYGFRNTASFIPSNADAGTDNSFLFILATTGVLGFLSYMSIWLLLLRKNNKNNYSKLFIASAIGLFVNCLFINSLFYPPLLLWMWMLAGITDSV